MKTTIINFDLSEKGLNNAISRIKIYKKSLIIKANILRQKMAERLADLAHNSFLNATVDDLLNNSPQQAQVDVIVEEKGNVSIVIAKGDDAIWVEFGAGVYHNGASGSSPHPKGSELGLTIGGYGKGKGKQNTWGFYKDGQLYLTHGTPALMPMYNSLKTVCEEILKITKEVWK